MQDSKKESIELRKQQVLDLISQCRAINELFGTDFIEKAINSFQCESDCKWSPKNYFIANYSMSMNQDHFITKLDKMLIYFLNNHLEFIRSKDTLSRLKSKDNKLFNGKWSEMIYAYYLHSKGKKNIEISVKEKTKMGEIEIFDIRTEDGEIEVTTIFSDKSILNIGDSLLGIVSTIESSQINLINTKKSPKKQDQNFSYRLYIC